MKKYILIFSLLGISSLYTMDYKKPYYKVNNSVEKDNSPGLQYCSPPLQNGIRRMVQINNKWAWLYTEHSTICLFDIENGQKLKGSQIEGVDKITLPQCPNVPLRGLILLTNQQLLKWETDNDGKPVLMNK